MTYLEIETISDIYALWLATCKLFMTSTAFAIGAANFTQKIQNPYSKPVHPEQWNDWEEGQEFAIQNESKVCLELEYNRLNEVAT